MNRPPRTFFLGTAKSGLGHLRRLAAIARQMSVMSSDPDFVLMTNANPGGLVQSELDVFTDIQVCEKPEMAGRLVQEECDLAVLDTLQLPGFEAYPGLAALVLRETPMANLTGFRRAGGRPWDLVIVPNPVADWRLDVGSDFSVSVAHVGWIVRKTGRRGSSPSTGIVLATGGGGTRETRACLYPMLEAIIIETRRRVARPFTLRQALGPRAGGAALAEADETFDPGADLNEVFRRADLVISTAGYNSVLELASTDTPALLTAIPRRHDDQMARVRKWGSSLGFGLLPGRTGDASAWLADQIERPRRRPPVDLGVEGAHRAATLLLELMCPVS